MIIVNMACGLANRMFQYAFYRKLLKDGVNAKVDYFTTKVLAHEDVAWTSIFPNAHYEQASSLQIHMMGGGKGIISKVIRKFIPQLTMVDEMPTAYSTYTPKSTHENKYLLGVFQNASVVENVRNELMEAFQFTPFEYARNRNLAFHLQEENSVAIHVRKGNDYQSRIWYQNTCPIEYYRKAIDYLKNQLDNPQFYVFTDNPTWVKENFIDFDYLLIDWNPGAGWGSHADMQLMSLAKHNIISNSTYSWWGAYLNSNPEKIVICPEIWFNPDSTPDYTSEKLLCKNWIAL